MHNSRDWEVKEHGANSGGHHMGGKHARSGLSSSPYNVTMLSCEGDLPSWTHLILIVSKGPTSKYS
jgi:hypothetical protein